MNGRNRRTGSLLLAVLGEELSLALLEGRLRSGVYVGEQKYQMQGGSDMTGFYDWLRSSTDCILGVRYAPLPGFSTMISSISNLPYVMVTPEGSLDIYFSVRREVEPTLSDDQAFGGNSQLLSDNGDWALTFETHFLTRAELASIQSAPARWLRDGCCLF